MHYVLYVQEFKDIMDNAKNGVILIAFGSTINLASMPLHMKNNFFDMMRQLPELTFIWRWDGPAPENPPENLIISKWLPQVQILGIFDSLCTMLSKLATFIN